MSLTQGYTLVKRKKEYEDMEIWKDIKGYEGLYQVNNYGQIKRGTRVLQPGIHPKGYQYVNLCKNNKVTTYRVHRLVAETFIPNPLKLPEVNHKDEDKLNNNINNLEWCTRKENLNYGTGNERRSKTRGIPVKCVETNTVYHSAREASRQTNIYASSISRCCNNEYGFKTAGGYHWEYV